MVLAGMGKNFLEFWHPGAHPCTLWQMTVANGTVKLILVNQKEEKKQCCVGLAHWAEFPLNIGNCNNAVWRRIFLSCERVLNLQVCVSTT